VDAMLHKLEKELDDVDIKIGDRWRILDRYVISQPVKQRENKDSSGVILYPMF
jgi:hypothetical protein